MSLVRLLLRVDRRLVAGSLGIAAAILLPLSGALVLGGLQPRLDPGQGWVAYRTDGTGLDLAGAPAPRLAVAEREAGGSRLFAYVVGDPGVGAGQVRPMPAAGPPPDGWGEVLPRSATAAPLLPPNGFLVHPSALADAPVTLALFDRAVHLPGAVAAPARGVDAFEDATTRDLAAGTGLLLAASIPAVALVALAFGLQEVREQRGATATLVALGGARWARLLLVARVLLVATAGLALAAGAGFLLWLSGPPFHPVPFPHGRVATALLAPFAAACLAGAGAALGRLGRVQEALRGTGSAATEPRLPLPAPLRPLLLGASVVPVLLVASLLFALDVGFPLAAAQVPGALAAGPGEWVLGAPGGLQVGAGVDDAVAAVAGLDPAVEAIVAETPVPTLVDGRPATLRGGAWDPLLAYHGLRLAGGRPPAPGELAVGEGMARRMGLAVGDTAWVQGSGAPWVEPLEVVGLVRGAGLLNDEGLLHPDTARALSGLPAGQSAFVRFRPPTPEAEAAVSRQEPLLMVTAVRGAAGAAAGDLAEARVTVANLGARAGQRELALRVDGTGVAGLTVVVPGHSMRTFAVPYLVPAGNYEVAVNPTSEESAGAAPLRLEAPPLVPPQAAFTVRALDADGRGVAGTTVALFANATSASQRSDPRGTAATDGEGAAALLAPAGGDWFVGTLAGPRAYAAVAVAESPGALVRVVALWTDPPAPRPGQAAQVLATVRNTGAAAGEADIHFFAGETPFDVQRVRLEPGASETLQARLVASQAIGSVRAGNLTLHLGSAPAPEPTPSSGPAAQLPLSPTRARSGEDLQAAVADRVLGNAAAALGGIAASALLSTLAVVYLATDRSLRSRSHVAGILEALGQDEAQVRRRATLEAGLLGAASLLLMLLPAKLLFRLSHAVGQPAPFAHALPDPVTPLFAVQSMAAFAAACALAAYLAAGPILRRSPLRPSTRAEHDALPPRPLPELLEGP